MDGADHPFGLVCILIALLLIRSAPPEPVPARVSRPSRPFAPRYRPGWGLAAAWITVSAVGWIAGIVALAVLMEAGSRINSDEEIAIAISLGFAFLLAIATGILHLTWLYQAWSAVPEDCRSATPGQAIGFLFIPFFNLYWLFRAVPGLSASVRRAREDYDLESPGSASFGWGIAACVVAIVPYLGVLAYFPFLVWVILANGEKNRMLESIERAFAEEE